MEPLTLPDASAFYSIANIKNEYILLFSGSENAYKFDLKRQTFSKIATKGEKCELRQFHTTNVWKDCNGDYWLVVFGGRVIEDVPVKFPNNVYMLNLGNSS